MSFYFAFAANTREKLHELADRQAGYSNVPAEAIAFIKASVGSWPDGTMVKVTANGHKAHPSHAEGAHLAEATMNIVVTPIVPTP